MWGFNSNLNKPYILLIDGLQFCIFFKRTTLNINMNVSQNIYLGSSIP